MISHLLWDSEGWTGVEAEQKHFGAGFDLRMNSKIWNSVKSSASHTWLRNQPLPALLLPGKEENSADTGNALPKPSQSQTPCLGLILALQGVPFSFSRRKHLSWLRLSQHLNNQGVFSSLQQSNLTLICESRNYPVKGNCSCWFGKAQMKFKELLP